MTAAIASLALVGCTSPEAPPLEIPSQSPTAVPCQYEDSVNCYWDAPKRGNSKGASFYADEDEVTEFNDGFTASKEDDCDQGFQPACDWVSANRT
ncbi:hypothetical protein [Streptomyces sp. SID14515]|uniref:hypothetical protein n=1 Tax=Streptomyces sp. SID14515 TaxID=2706074 RepID=UPI0013C866D0|nr:hypothetical protein [Streptomyces sp. SID14515]NEB42571.1 hypothetical protein [Streptomyces sp. SID14515]